MQLHSWRQNEEESARGEDDDGDLDAQAPLLGQLPQKDELAKACQRYKVGRCGVSVKAHLSKVA